jgi:Nucleoside-diphosphate-sugar epimerases
MSECGGLYLGVPEADVWVNLAWEGTGHDGRNQEEVQQANVVNTIAAMFGADKMGCRLFVEAGSQAEYGTVLTSISEATPCNPFSAYGKAKLEVCRRLSELSAELGIKYLHLRIFSLFGEGDHPWTLVMSSLDKMLRNEAVDLSPCTQHWDFLYVKDAARQIASLCDDALKIKEFRSEVYHIASGDSRPLKDFVERMKVLTGSESKLNYGAVIPQYVVSLQPDMSKTQAVVGKLCEYSFDDVINRMIEKLRNDKGK